MGKKKSGGFSWTGGSGGGRGRSGGGGSSGRSRGSGSGSSSGGGRGRSSGGNSVGRNYVRSAEQASRDMSRERRRQQQDSDRGERAYRSGGGRWTPASSQPPDVGVIEGTNDVVSFKTSGDETLIADGDFSDDREGFDNDPDGSKAHDHYGPWGGTRRGRYSGPNS